ncbi:MAG TPA: DUF2141 domain-containing protein [Mucilaginibacter sp.]|jgi:uncharacterized protein (DUF2141 family)|nr:DUF2141 domain-containing protein [Mucilaginibacter sp.]
MLKLAFALLLSGLLFTDQASLKIVVRNIQVGKGSVVVEVYNDEKLFLKKPLVSETRKAGSATMEFSFNVPAGMYAVAVYQDLNDNKKLDAGLFQIPKEPFGFSNNYRPSFSAPDYKDCMIQVKGQTICTISLK